MQLPNNAYGVKLADYNLTMDSLVELSDNCGSFYFSPDTLRWFKSNLSSYGDVVRMSPRVYRFVYSQAAGFDGGRVYVVTEMTIDRTRVDSAGWSRWRVSFNNLRHANSDEFGRATFTTRRAAIAATKTLVTD